jgi:SAM-dependent methyltransferase
LQNQDFAEDLIKFVKQADNVPNAKWFLRKIEWAWSLRCIGKPPNSHSMILDIASEVRVSHSLFKDSWNIWRIDFSSESAEQARKDGPKYGAHIVIDPVRPKLPLSGEFFDAAISIGPFDFKFLDVDALLKEVKTVLGKGGKFVFSLPTPKSPYCNRDSVQNFRFWSPKDISHIIQEWKVGESHRINIPQPSWVYSRIGHTSRIPARVFDAFITKPLLSLCPLIPKSLASYVILSLCKRSDS